jgi:hypothetical protein
MLFGFGVDSSNLLIMSFLMTKGDLKQKDLASRLMCFGANGVGTFQGLRSKVTI